MVKSNAKIPPTDVAGTTHSGFDIEECEKDLLAGRYEDVIEATSNKLDDPRVCVAHIRALSNMDSESAVRCCEDLLMQHPLSHELQYLHSLLLLDHREEDQAAVAAQRAVYLNPDSAPAHFLLGAIEEKRGFVDVARRRAPERRRRVAVVMLHGMNAL